MCSRPYLVIRSLTYAVFPKMRKDGIVFLLGQETLMVLK